MSTPKLTTEIINAAIEGFEAQKSHLDSQITKIRQMLDGATTPKSAPRTGKVAAAARRRMPAGPKKRWAALKDEPEASLPAPVEAPKPKRRISEEGMKRIIAATKKRWRLAKSAKAQPKAANKASAKAAK